MSSSYPFPKNNGAVLMILQIIKAIMSSAALAELGSLLINVREYVYMQKMLKEMGHKQNQTLTQTDNRKPEGVTKKKYNQNIPRA